MEDKRPTRKEVLTCFHEAAMSKKPDELTDDAIIRCMKENGFIKPDPLEEARKQYLQGVTGNFQLDTKLSWARNYIRILEEEINKRE